MDVSVPLLFQLITTAKRLPFSRMPSLFLLHSRLGRYHFRIASDLSHQETAGLAGFRGIVETGADLIRDPKQWGNVRDCAVLGNVRRQMEREKERICCQPVPEFDICRYTFLLA